MYVLRGMIWSWKVAISTVCIRYILLSMLNTCTQKRSIGMGFYVILKITQPEGKTLQGFSHVSREKTLTISVKVHLFSTFDTLATE